MRFAAYILCIALFAFTNNTVKATSPPPSQTKDSVVITKHDNGKIKEKGSYRNGKKHGKWKTYDENGVLLKVVKYKKGEFWWERLYKKGKLSQITDRKGRITKMKDCGC